MLAYTLNDHEGALRASLLAEYGVRLSSHGMSVSELGDLVAALPAGCALWQSVGGPMAWSQEMHLLNLIEYRMNVSNWFQTKDGQSGRNQPKPPSYPPYAHEKRADESRQSARAEAWARRQARHNDRA